MINKEYETKGGLIHFGRQNAWKGTQIKVCSAATLGLSTAVLGLAPWYYTKTKGKHQHLKNQFEQSKSTELTPMVDFMKNTIGGRFN